MMPFPSSCCCSIRYGTVSCAPWRLRWLAVKTSDFTGLSRGHGECKGRCAGHRLAEQVALDFVASIGGEEFAGPGSPPLRRSPSVRGSGPGQWCHGDGAVVEIVLDVADEGTVDLEMVDVERA